MARIRHSFPGIARLDRKALSVACILTLGMGAPAQAELGADQILGIGIQLLNQSQRAEQDRARRQQPTQQRQIRPDPGATQDSRRPRPVRSEAVAEAQRRLNELGYDAGTVDGFSGPQTRRAITRFQQDFGLAPTGQADPQLISVLRSQAATSMRAASAPAGAEMQMLVGMHLPGGDYRSGLSDPALVGTGIDGCADLCTRDDVCAGFTYSIDARICTLKDSLRPETHFPRAVSGIKIGGAQGGGIAGDRLGSGTAPVIASRADARAGAGAAPDPAMPNPAGQTAGQTAATPVSDPPVAPGPEPGALPTLADFVHLRLMSDTEAYRAEADEWAHAYLAATATGDQCKEITAALQGDEFSRRDFMARAAEHFRQALDTLGTRPRRVEMPLEVVYPLHDYDFDRGGYELPEFGSSGMRIFQPAIIRPALPRDRSRAACTNMGSGDLLDMAVEHKGVAGEAFLPMSEADARAFRAKGSGSVALRGTLIVEPRDHGRGPLKGRIANLAAYDAEDGQLLYRWEVPPATDTPADQDAPPEWSGALIASLIAPVIEPYLTDDQLDGSATGYFSVNASEIANGNLPPGSPLPIEELRGKPVATVMAQNRDKLREFLRKAGPALPLTVEISQEVPALFKDGEGLLIDADGGDAADTDPLSRIELSDRDLPLNDQLLPRQLQGSNDNFVTAVAASGGVGIKMELDRVIAPTTVPMTRDEAAERGYTGNRNADQVIAHWVLNITETRATPETAIISASIRSLSYRWASDGRLIHDVPTGDLSTVVALRDAADAARGVLTSASEILTPPDGSRWGGEMTDLMQMRHIPDSVDDRMVERMMLSRAGYERGISDGVPPWGRFFRDAENLPSIEERQARRGEFRDWSMARAQAMPARLTVLVPVRREADGQRALFEKGGNTDVMFNCENPTAPKGQEVRSMVQQRICRFLAAAWTAPEPLLFLNEDPHGTIRTVNLRDRCVDDSYCAAISDARKLMEIPRPEASDILRVDRLPVMDDAARQQKGDLAIELLVEPTGATLQDSAPASIWLAARMRADDFARQRGFSEFSAVPLGASPEPPFLVMDAKAISARLIDRKTGESLGDLALAEPAPLTEDALAMPESVTAKLDVLGIQLGMSFDEADRLIREHMQVGKVLSADRSRQLSTASGALMPYGSGRIYASAAGDELIAILDEPPAAPNQVLGIWRILRLPKGSVDPLGLKATLAERYGEPDSIEETQLAFMVKGLTWAWQDASDRRCDALDFDNQDGMWQDETGQTGWLPPFMKRPLFPVLLHPGNFDHISDDPITFANFCRGILGVRFASYDKDNREQTVGDEIITWLSDNRAYARHLLESRKAPVAAPAAPVGASGAPIKF